MIWIILISICGIATTVMGVAAVTFAAKNDYDKAKVCLWIAILGVPLAIIFGVLFVLTGVA